MVRVRSRDSLARSISETGLARNVARQLAIYAKGAPVRFSNRDAIERIIEPAKASNYGIRDIVHAIIQSDLFLDK